MSRERESNGECFVQTDALDGERNLKSKLAIKSVNMNLKEYFKDGNVLTTEVKPPTKALYQFEGLFKVQDFSRTKSGEPPKEIFRQVIGFEQFLHRGATLKNTELVYALVVFTGTDTKII